MLLEPMSSRALIDSILAYLAYFGRTKTMTLYDALDLELGVDFYTEFVPTMLHLVADFQIIWEITQDRGEYLSLYTHLREVYNLDILKYEHRSFDKMIWKPGLDIIQYLN